jgi:sugar O-acyltransferase (sialic acid O-acetyltransferase NeuD family)
MAFLVVVLFARACGKFTNIDRLKQGTQRVRRTVDVACTSHYATLTGESLSVGEQPMSELHILGHCNATLAILVDSVGASRWAISRVTVVSNIPVTDETPWQPHGSFGFSVRELPSRDWDGQFEELIMGVYKPETKRIVYEAFSGSHGIQRSDYSSLYHLSAIVSAQARVGHGVFLAPGAIIAPFATLGDLVTINRNTSIGHHTTIGAFSSINPGCNIGGKCEVGENVTIGLGSAVLDHVTIGRNTVIGAGSVVTRSIPEDVVAWGAPAKVIRPRSESK